MPVSGFCASLFGKTIRNVRLNVFSTSGAAVPGTAAPTSCGIALEVPPGPRKGSLEKVASLVSSGGMIWDGLNSEKLAETGQCSAFCVEIVWKLMVISGNICVGLGAK